ncbi:MAG: hypothetical protein P8J27_11175 [Mariniblastus sp.]|nr:hypothetical protein [Mariniblastus sp.]
MIASEEEATIQIAKRKQFDSFWLKEQYFVSASQGFFNDAGLSHIDVQISPRHDHDDWLIGMRATIFIDRMTASFCMERN